MVSMSRSKPSEYHRKLATANQRKASVLVEWIGRPVNAQLKANYERQLIDTREAIRFHLEAAEKLEAEGR